MIDTKSESLITLKEARGEFPNRPSIPTLWRWILKGSNGVILESIRIGGRRYTSREACQQFIEACSLRPSKSKRSASNNTGQAVAHAQAVLDQFGV